MRVRGNYADLTFNNPIEVMEALIPRLRNSRGQWTPFDAASVLYTRAELRTNATPPIVLNVKQLGDTDGPPNPLAAALKPTLILTGPMGTKVIAPYGQASATAGSYVGFGALATVALVLGGVGFAAGRWSARR